MTNVIWPSWPTRIKALGLNSSGMTLPAICALSPDANTLNPNKSPPPKAMPAFRTALRSTPGDTSSLNSRLRPITRFLDGGNSRSLCRLFDGGTNALIGAAAANVCGHRRVDINVAGVGISCQQRRRRHDLARLAIAALNDLEIEPRLLNLSPNGGFADLLD